MKNKRLRYGDKRLVKVGKTLSVELGKKHIKLCNYGMHASRRLVDAVYYAPEPEPILCRVKVWGNIKEDASKLVGANRQCLLMIPDAYKIINEYFLQKALRSKSTTKALKSVIKATIEYTKGKISLVKLKKLLSEFSGVEDCSKSMVLGYSLILSVIDKTPFCDGSKADYLVREEI